MPGLAKQAYDIAAYFWPAYHDEPRWRRFMPDGEGEWQTIRQAQPKFDGHRQPRVPVWGHEMDDDPAVMAKKIDAAAEHGVNVFIYDWYWFDNRPFLEESLNRGFLKAPNNDRIQFFLMWANHDAKTVWDLRTSHRRDVIWPGAVDRATFERIGARWTQRYFGHPSYYLIDGKPVVSIYEISNLVNGMGGLDETRRALDDLRSHVRTAGFPGLHIQAILWGRMPESISGVPGDTEPTQGKTVDTLGFDSLTTYQWCHTVRPRGRYTDWAGKSMGKWTVWADEFGVPYYPHVSVGWDTNPRYKSFRENVITGDAPEFFAAALSKAMDHVDQHHLKPHLITVNSWNEWSEGSYLEPDTTFGMGYLEAVRKTLAARTGGTK
jgi:hypothetical protein